MCRLVGRTTRRRCRSAGAHYSDPLRSRSNNLSEWSSSRPPPYANPSDRSAAVRPFGRHALLPSGTALGRALAFGIVLLTTASSLSEKRQSTGNYKSFCFLIKLLRIFASPSSDSINIATGSKIEPGSTNLRARQCFPHRDGRPFQLTIAADCNSGVSRFVRAPRFVIYDALINALS